MAGTLVVAELHDGKVRKSTLSAITFAKQVGSPFAIVAMGAGAASVAKDLGGTGPRRSSSSTMPGAQGLCVRAVFADSGEANDRWRLGHRGRDGELVR